jgi:hypothetical protein
MNSQYQTSTANTAYNCKITIADKKKADDSASTSAL